MEKQIILFGAGEIGRKALSYFGKEKVYRFVDNSASKVGAEVDDIAVISFAELKRIYKDYQIIISVDPKKFFVIAAQLDDAGIKGYQSYLKMMREGNMTVQKPVSPERVTVSSSCERKKVLMIAYFFPPLGGSGVYRSVKFVKYLRNFSWEPTVIATDQAPPEQDFMDESLTREIPEGTEVIRIPDWIGTLRRTAFPDYKNEILDFLECILRQDEEAAKAFESLKENKTGEAELLTTPCAALTWAYDVVQYIEENMDIQQFQAIYTTSAPYSAHLIGSYFKRKYGIPWVADYRDPWTNNPYFDYDENSIWYKLFAALESILLRSADCNITPGPTLVESYVERFQLERGKVVCITNGYDEADFCALQIPKCPPEHFTINYSGVFYSQGRSIIPILQALQQLCDEEQIDRKTIRFRIVGPENTHNTELAASYGLQDAMVQTGYVSHAEALQSNLNANILLLLVGSEAKFKIAFLGKFFEYLRSGRPILAIVARGGVIDQKLQETGHGEAFLETDISHMKGMILREYQKWQSGEIQEVLHSPAIRQYERKRLTELLADVLDTVCQ